jgi:hypothetical protein
MTGLCGEEAVADFYKTPRQLTLSFSAPLRIFCKRLMPVMPDEEDASLRQPCRRLVQHDKCLEKVKIKKAPHQSDEGLL